MTRRPFRVLVADDEPLARGTLVDLVGADAECELVGEAGDGRTALAAIRERRPEIVFLDIEMPELDGLRVGQELGRALDDAFYQSLDQSLDQSLEGALEEDGAAAPSPVLVYVTAYAEHASRAFDVAATDYLVKPFSDQRFATALTRAKHRVRERRMNELAGRVAQLAEELAPQASSAHANARAAVQTRDELATASAAARTAERARPLERLTIKTGSRSLIVRADEIVWIESEDYYVRVHSAQGRHLLRASLDRLEERLDPNRFVRVHRKALVAIPEVREVVDLFKGARAALLSDGSRVRISRARWKAVQPLLLPSA